MLEQGPSKSTNLMEWDKMWAINKRIIDPLCTRFMAVSVDKASVLEVLNGPEKPEIHTVACSPTNAAVGNRPYWRSKNILLEFQDADEIKVDEKVTFMNWGNFLIKSKEIQPDGSYKLTGLFLEDDKDWKKTRKYTWLAKVYILSFRMPILLRLSLWSMTISSKLRRSKRMWQSKTLLTSTRGSPGYAMFSPTSDCYSKTTTFNF
jgi:hypothetical protein